MHTSQSQAPDRQRRIARGFTLLELMVSLTVGGIAITSIYAIGASTTRQFHQQQSVASTQSALRAALDRVKRDISRAGYLSTPNINVSDPTSSLPIEGCALVGPPFDSPAGDGRLAGVSLFLDYQPSPQGSGMDPTGNNAANGFTHDEIRLIGNYATSDQYAGVELLGGSTDTVLVPQNWHAYRRDFTNWFQNPAPTHLSEPFNAAFRVGRLVRIMTTTRKKHFAMITSVSNPGQGALALTDPARIRFSPAVPASCVNDVQGGWVAPVSVMRYFVQDAPASEAGRFSEVTGAMAQLVRQETMPDDKLTPLTDAQGVGNTRVVLDYVVGFNLQFQMNGPTTVGTRDTYTLGTLISNAPEVNSNPERVRAVQIDLAARTSQGDPAFQWTQTGCAGLRCFQVTDAPAAGAARVRRARATVFMPNIAYEGY